MTVTHQSIFKPNAFGGVTTTTLCGRVSNASDDLNVNTGEAVTCKLCRKILAADFHPRKRWLGWKPED